ncbi:FAD-dependent monooxygenase [Chitinophagaceae bacterium MMS25-I14]
MSSEKEKRFAIIGGGIAGLTTAIALNKFGINPVIFEAAPEIKPVGAGLLLASNAIKAFRKLGIAEEVMNEGWKLPGFCVYDGNGNVISETKTLFNKEKDPDNFTIHRAALHKVLLSKIDLQYVFVNKKVASIQQGKENVTIHFTDESTYKTDYLVAADGINSVVRNTLLPGVKPRYAGYTCWRAVIDNPGLQLDCTSETWDVKGRFGVAPSKNNKVYWFACINAPALSEKMKAFTIEDLQEHFKNFHGVVTALLGNTKTADLIWADIQDLKPLNRYAYGNVLLIGDAAHATTPNMGQGACQAIEDAVVLADELCKTSDVLEAFRSFEKRCLSRTHYIIKTSRAIGRIAQTESKLLAGLRNRIFGLLPQSFKEKKLSKTYEVDFE